MQQFQAALKRALIAAGITAVPILIDYAQTATWEPKYAVYILVGVRIAEGLYDSWRQAAGKVSSADVGQ